MLSLNKPLIFFDIESTGIDPAKDRIVQIALAKYGPGWTMIDSREYLVNPGIPIPPDATAVHGITNADVANKPSFASIAKEVVAFIDGCDLGGFNILRYDVPMLAEELGRCGIEFPASDIRFVDAQTIFFRKEERTLGAAYKFYCNQQLENAHSAMADAQATKEVFLAQLQKYPDLNTSIEDLHMFCGADKIVDPAKKLLLSPTGDVVYAFGKYRNQRVVDFPDYANWMLQNDFPDSTKRVLKKLLEKKEF
jgi:DNA polymerase-3 subunit epsilon